MNLHWEIMKNTFIKLLFVVLMFAAGFASGQNNIEHKTIRWEGIREVAVGDGSIALLDFENAANDDAFGVLPAFEKMIALPGSGFSYHFEIDNPQFVAFEDQDEISGLPDIELVTERLQTVTHEVVISGKTYTVFRLLPMRKNPETGVYEKLIAFDLTKNLGASEAAGAGSPETFAENSVLATGDWFKVSVTKSGVYKLTYAQLKEMGMDVDNVDPQTIRLYGNGGGMLPERNAVFTYDDLVENAILVEDGNDGSFDPGDYLLFFGESPDKWVYEPIKLAFNFR